MGYRIEGCFCCGKPLGAEQGITCDPCGCRPSCEGCVAHHACGSHPLRFTPCPTKGVRSFLTLRHAIEAASPASDKTFYEILAEGWEKKLYNEDELADLFGTSIPTAQRWILGFNAPHPAMRPVVYKELLHLVDKKMAQSGDYA